MKPNNDLLNDETLVSDPLPDGISNANSQVVPVAIPETDPVNTSKPDIHYNLATTAAVSGKKHIEHYPKSNRVLTGFVLAFMGGGVYIFDYVMRYSGFDAGIPYSIVMDFYRITLVEPAQSFINVWLWLSGLELASSHGINQAISIIGMALYAGLFLYLYALFIEVIGIMIARLGRYDKPDIMGAFQLYCLPALVVSAYFLIVHALLLSNELGLINI